MRMQRDRFADDTVNSGTDEVLCAWAVPAETTILSIKGHVLMNGTSSLNHTNNCAYAMDGWVFEIPDDLMETAVSAVYDAMVAKYSGTLGFDFDEEVADTAPGWEPGEIRNDLLGMVDAPDHIYQRRKYLGFADAHGYHEITAGSVWGWIPVDKYSISREGARKADGMSVCCFAASSPSNDALVSETKVFPTFGGTAKSEWLWLKYLDQALENAMVSMLGLVSGAPFDNLLNLIEFEISSANVIGAGGLTDVNWTTFMAASMMWESGSKARIRLASD